MTPLYQKVQNKPSGARNSSYHQGDGRQNVLGRPRFGRPLIGVFAGRVHPSTRVARALCRQARLPRVIL